ncbi:MAG: c-type cytochrome biogenesis protein CcsB [Actinomycetota bacterium]|nr:c-type cytochrome biogenesis protein CcsB [Actinomycetota bacterium]
MTETLATLSNNTLYSATVVYALAMLAHVAEWAMAHQLPAEVSMSGRGRRSALVSSRASSSAGSGEEAASAVAPAPAASEEEVERSDRYGRIGLALTVLGLLLHCVGVVARGIAAERVPWGSMYEFSITSSLAVAAAYLFLVRRYRVRWLGLLVTGFLVVVLGIALLVLYRPVAPLVPALHSYWLAIHVSAAAIAGGAFTVGALASVLYLLRNRLEVRGATRPELPRTGFLWRTPPAADIDRVSYRVHAFAFPVWTFAVLAGAIWAEYAWSRYWGWDPKEVWALITWVVYAAYLHARATAGWQGRAAAYVALLGYATFLFNFVGVNLLGSGLHAYSGL